MAVQKSIGSDVESGVMALSISRRVFSVSPGENPSQLDKSSTRLRN
jgi:hypothetical protein